MPVLEFTIEVDGAEWVVDIENGIGWASPDPDADDGICFDATSIGPNALEKMIRAKATNRSKSEE